MKTWKQWVENEGLEPWTLLCKRSVLANYTTNPISRVDKTRTCIVCIPNAGGCQLPYYSICGEHCTRNKCLIKGTHCLADRTITSIVYSPLISLSKNMRRNEVPTPKHFTVHIVFKTSLSPTELLLQLPNHRCDIGLFLRKGSWLWGNRTLTFTLTVWYANHYTT